MIHTAHEIVEAPELDPSLVTAGLGPDAWRYLRRLSEPRALLRVARWADPWTRARTVQVVKPLPLGEFRTLLEARPEAAVHWRAEGWVAPVGAVPGKVTYFAITAAGRAAEARLRPAVECEPRHLGSGEPAPEAPAKSRRRALVAQARRRGAEGAA